MSVKSFLLNWINRPVSEFLPVQDVLAIREKLSEVAVCRWINSKTIDRIIRLLIKAISITVAYVTTIQQIVDMIRRAVTGG